MAKTIKQRWRRLKDRAGIWQDQMHLGQIVASTTAGAEPGDLRAKALRANATEKGRKGKGC
uniref:Uncharacterized protein n=1 Tax=Oryza sativa subsp. japonica TaxID=39947 RepID=Q850W9_ORYSJ|nr:hypothetical protein [Oryza sativa Japonica Group]